MLTRFNSFVEIFRKSNRWRWMFLKSMLWKRKRKWIKFHHGLTNLFVLVNNQIFCSRIYFSTSGPIILAICFFCPFLQSHKFQNSTFEIFQLRIEKVSPLIWEQQLMTSNSPLIKEMLWAMLLRAVFARWWSDFDWFESRKPLNVMVKWSFQKVKTIHEQW
jgi:hypothetical protein